MKTIRCASVFSDHCVLQRNKEIRIWGVATDDTPITVTLNGCSAATTSHNNKWQVTLPPMEAGGPYTLELLSEGTIYQHLEDIMLGEVWLAGGQSNMEFALSADADGKEAIASAPTANVRFYQVHQHAYKDDYFYQAERDNHWMTGTDEEVGIWSAVGFYFGRKLAAELGVTVGIIGCNWGGTSACAWQDKDSICQYEDTKIYWEEYAELIRKQNPEEYEKELEEYKAWHADWQPRMDAYYAEHPTATWDEAQAAVGLCKWPGPMGPKHEFRPAGLYETMLQRVVPYTLGGCIYYQGESDDHRPQSYYHLFKSLICVWRREFQDASLPFVYVQLPIHHYLSDEPNDKWCYIREAQMQLHKELPHTGIAVAMDCGEYNNIHPIHKSEVGRRLALQALHNIFDVLSASEAYGPLYAGFAVEGNALRITFEHAKQGFFVKGEEITGFELAGADGIYHPAQAVIRDNDILLTCQEVSAPVRARYLWVDYAEVTLFGTNGLPVAPFRTDCPY
ncbi:MAG: sialate O-acetylesterase [Lachnospiraceae bacterium]|nr:sialate O-acetylesterase [Lachnospiraceae bacterium]